MESLVAPALGPGRRAPLEDVGAISDAGAINVIYGSAGGLTTTGDQQFWQDAAGVAGRAETFDSFGLALT